MIVSSEAGSKHDDTLHFWDKVQLRGKKTEKKTYLTWSYA